MRKTDWISVNDRQPKDGECVLMLSRYWNQYGNERWSIEEHVFFEEGGFKIHELESVEERITHWMPIELPDEYENIH